VWNIQIARIGGIAVDVHLTFGLVILWGAWQGWEQHGSFFGAVYGISAIMLLFLCVLLHELAHGLQARRLGLVVRRITLLPIGGLAQLESPPSYPLHELLIAVSGPLVNLILGVVFGLTTLFVQPSTGGSWWDNLIQSLFFSTPDLVGMLFYLTATNLMLFGFNMLPAFPMDGGRVLRAALALVVDYEQATRMASWLGRIIALGLGTFGLIGWAGVNIPPNPALVVLAVVIYSGARHEELYVRRQRALVRVEVGEVLYHPPQVLGPWDTVTHSLIAQLFKSESTLPVVVDDRVVGLLTYQDVEKRLRGPDHSVTVAHVMRTDFPTLRPRDTLWIAHQEMNAEQLAALPVVDNGHFKGVISLDDIDQAWKLSSRQRRDHSSLVSGDTELDDNNYASYPEDAARPTR
jgi:Zn-dependent protease/predicted transcriptional regulator